MIKAVFWIETAFLCGYPQESPYQGKHKSQKLNILVHLT